MHVWRAKEAQYARLKSKRAQYVSFKSKEAQHTVLPEDSTHVPKHAADI